MTEHQFFIVISFGAAALAVLMEVAMVRLRSQRTLERLRNNKMAESA